MNAIERDFQGHCQVNIAISTFLLQINPRTILYYITFN